MTNYFKIDDVEVKQVIRIGNHDEKRPLDNPRPLRVTVEDEGKRSVTLFRAKELKTADSDEIKAVFIAPDRTKKERDRSEVLREELKRRKEKGEVDLIIRRGRLVQNRKVDQDKKKPEDKDKENAGQEREVDKVKVPGPPHDTWGWKWIWK